VIEMKFIRYYFLSILLLPLVAVAQVRDSVPDSSEQVFINSPDSLPHVQLKPVTVFPLPKDMSPRQRRQYNSLELKVKKVYPMAKLASVKLGEYNRVYSSFKNERERKNYVKKVEKDLFAEFEGEIRKMKVSEGRILIKLLDRETGNSSYEIIKEFKGGFSAFFWQSVARLFGHDLKAQYDPYVEDRLIEYIVWEIEMGLI
jgi:hypothetical protein